MSTMRPEDLLEQLERLQVEVRVEGDRLHVRAPKGALSAELRSLIGTHKPALLALLAARHREARSERPLAEGQRALWFLNQLVPDGSAYNTSLALLLRGPLVIPALVSAAVRLGELHPLLRARFHAPDGEPFMQIEAGSQLVARVVEVPERSLEAIQAEVQALSERPFDLSKEGATRLVLFVRSATEAVMLLSIHHIILDYWSLTLLVEDLIALYQQARGGAPSGPSAPPRSYDDFVRSQRRFLEAPAGLKQRAFWHARLAGELPDLELPTDHPRPTIRSERGGEVRAMLEQELTSRLRRLAMTESATSFAICVSGLAALLHRYTGQDELLLGTPYHGRSEAGYERTVGYFINPLVLRVRVAPDMTFRSLVAQVHGHIIEALAHADYPFVRLVESLGVRRAPGRNPIYQITVDSLGSMDPIARALWEPERSEPIPFADLRATPLPLGQLNGISDQIWMIADLRDRIAVKLGYSSDLFTSESARSMLEHYARLMEDASANPDKEIAALSGSPVPARAPRRIPPRAVAPQVPAAPRDPLEQSLITIWERVLRRQPIGARDDFFALGGHSLLAVQLRVQVQKELGKDFPLSLLSEGGTVEHLAQFLRQDFHPAQPATLVTLREGDRRPLFLFHPIGGGVLCYASLARRLRAGDLICGLQSPALAPNGPRPATLESLAAEYLIALRARQSTGPYRLAGWSFGGVIALEVARQLALHGDQTEQLTLIDSPPPTLFGALPGTDNAAIVNWLQAQEASGIGPSADPGARALADEQQRVYAYHLELFRAYGFRPCLQPTTLIFAGERHPLPSIAEATAAWEAICPRIARIDTVPGGHFSLITNEESLRKIAQILDGA